MSYSAHRKKKRGGPKEGARKPRWRRSRLRHRMGPVNWVDIMREVWPQESIRAYMFGEPVTYRRERPWWAKLARKHRWMTESEYFAVPLETRVLPRDEQVPGYADHPLYALLPKDALAP